MRDRIRVASLCVFIPIEIMFELPVNQVEQLRIVAIQPAFGIVATQRPSHDVDALIYNDSG